MEIEAVLEFVSILTLILGSGTIRIQNLIAQTTKEPRLETLLSKILAFAKTSALLALVTVTVPSEIIVAIIDLRF